MIDADKRNSIKYLLATIISATIVLSLCFYVAKITTENKRLAQVNRSLLLVVEKEQNRNAWFEEEMAKLRQSIQNERRAQESAAMSSDSYQKLFPELNVERATSYKSIDSKVIYLTLDDGPFAMSSRYLDLLKKHDVKATFFVVGRGDRANKARIKRMADEGHTVAAHSYTHKYNKIYASVGEFLHDFKQINDLIVSATGKKPDIFRFPGGSVNIYNKDTCRQIIEEMQRRGYTYYDWSISSGDTAKNATAKTTEENVMNKIARTPHKIILMHEGKADTLAALENIIVKLKKKGYRFEGLTNEIQPIHLKLPPVEQKSVKR